MLIEAFISYQSAQYQVERMARNENHSCHNRSKQKADKIRNGVPGNSGRKTPTTPIIRLKVPTINNIVFLSGFKALSIDLLPIQFDY